MRIVVTHLTRRQPGFICVAGLDTSTGQHVRPVLGADEALGVHLLAGGGGPFRLGAEVDLGPVTPRGVPPAVENVLFDAKRASRVSDLAPHEFWALLESVAKRSLRGIFGEELHPEGRTAALDAGRGLASLGCLRPSRLLRVYVDPYGNCRVALADGDCSYSRVALADLRAHEPREWTPRDRVVSDLADRALRGEGVLLSVGVPVAAWQKPGDDVERHWLQVNNIHLEHDPLWGVD